MSLLKKCFETSSLRKVCVSHSLQCISSPLSTAREISEESHKKVLKYVLRKQLKSCMMKTTVEEKPAKLHVLRDVILKERKWQMTDMPGTNEIILRKEVGDETIVVKFDAWHPEEGKTLDEQIFTVKISKNEKCARGLHYYYIFQMSTHPELETVNVKCHGYGDNEDDESQGFEPTHSKQPEEITQYCEVYLFERGIDYDLALFVQLESARKFTREKTFALKGLIDFLSNEDYLD